MNSRMFFFACFLFLISACEKGEEVVDPDRIYSTYELIYDLNENKTTAKAKLSLDGPEGELVKIKLPAEITFNNEPLVLNTSNFEYFTEFQGLVDSGTFTYISSDNHTFINSTPKINPILIPEMEIINTRQNLEFRWIGKPIGINEAVVLRIEGSQSALTLQSSQAGDTVFFIAEADLRKVDRFGSGVINIKRSYSAYMNTGTATGGRMSTTYRQEEFILFKNN